MYKYRFVNTYQSKELRRFKYNFARNKNVSRLVCYRVRDFTINHYCKFLSKLYPIKLGDCEIKFKIERYNKGVK